MVFSPRSLPFSSLPASCVVAPFLRSACCISWARFFPTPCKELCRDQGKVGLFRLPLRGVDNHRADSAFSDFP
jgi:hypothetical protein